MCLLRSVVVSGVVSRGARGCGVPSKTVDVQSALRGCVCCDQCVYKTSWASTVGVSSVVECVPDVVSVVGTVASLSHSYGHSELRDVSARVSGCVCGCGCVLCGSGCV